MPATSLLSRRTCPPRRALSALLVAVAACGDPSGPGDELVPIELPRALTADEARVVADANGFGFALLGALLERDERANVVLSPLSASLALGMTLNGAGSHTFEAMRGALGFEGLDQPAINEAYRGLIDLLTDLDPEARLAIANSVWAREGVPFEQAFVDAVRSAFDAATETRDFSDPATVDEINAWVAEHTGGLIDEIVDALDPSLVMLLLNAVYFDAPWTTRFDPADTRRQSFRRADGSEVEVDMMHLADVELGLANGADFQAVDLPYGGGAFSMTLVLPPADVPVGEYLSGLDAVAWAGIVGALHPVEVDDVAIPKLALTFDVFLNDALKAIGMEDAFLPGADFTPLSPVGASMCIGFVRQKTFLEVDERGTRAAAVTGSGISVTSFLGLAVDRPFAFALRERLTGTILFLGAVGDPTAEDPGPEPYVDTCR